jgi:hypothetical protein
MPATALARKLGFKPGHRAVILGVQPGVLEQLEPLPEAASLATRAGRTRADLVLVFVADSTALARALPGALAAVKDGGVLWVAYPKGGKKAGTDLNRDILWRELGEHGLTGVTLVAVDDTWSAMRVRH